MVKKIWTASFGLFAAGWTCLIFAFFHSLTAGLGKKAWANPFMIAGMNSIFLYMSAGILTGQFRNLLMPFTSHVLTGLGNWGPVLLALLVVCCHWSLAYWLYRRKIFFKV
jgi:predicted acyltransferase